MSVIIKNGITYSANGMTSSNAGYVRRSGDTMTGALSITNSTASTSITSGALKVSGGIGCAGSIYGNKVYGAVWNDFAEYRATTDNWIPGTCVCENGDGTLSISTKRLQKGGRIISDTFGFAIGETDECKTPVAVAGRVLAYPNEDINKYKPGDAVCVGPNGTISKMNRFEIILFPDCILGTVSEIPNYEYWGNENDQVQILNRIWINVK